LYTFYTGVDRDASKILKVQQKRKLINNENLLQIRDQSQELFKLIQSDKFSTKIFGEFLDKGWMLKKKLSDQISNKYINDLYDIAKKNGAYGGKLSGAGGGGFLSFVIKKNYKNKIIKLLSKKKLKYFPVRIDNTGSVILSKN
jgi:D-glycero-alpha-D-manno-heptose-7-phosphate kinase